MAAINVLRNPSFLTLLVVAALAFGISIIVMLINYK